MLRNLARSSVLTLAVILCLAGSAANAQQSGPQVATPQAPVGFLLIEEEQWNTLADEPGRHFGRARDAFLIMDARVAAAEIRKAAVHLRIAAGHAKERTKGALVQSEHELEQMARRIEAGTYRSVEEFDFATARALHALADDQYVKAAEAWRKREVRRSGQYLRAATDNLERAASRTESGMKQATGVVVKDSRLISGKLIEGTGFVIDEVGVGFEAVGRQIERVGKIVTPTATGSR